MDFNDYKIFKWVDNRITELEIKVRILEFDLKKIRQEKSNEKKIIDDFEESETENIPIIKNKGE